MKLKFNIVDNSFGHEYSCCTGQIPELVEFERDRTKFNPNNYTIYTNWSIPKCAEDLRLKRVDKDKIILWAFESPAIYQDVFNDLNTFSKYAKYVFTFLTHYVNYNPDIYKFVPAGGIWIGGKEWAGGGGKVGIGEKNKLCSIICSNKRITPAHAYRQHVSKIIAEQRPDVDGYGEFFDNKLQYVADAIAPYKFSICIENGQYDGYFTEKILNCFACGTIPIYWGAKNIGSYFDEKGIINLQDYLDGKVVPSNDLYSSLQNVIKDNMKRALEYTIPEDYFAKNIFKPNN